VYLFLINGTATVNGQLLYSRDGIGIWDTDNIEISIGEDAELLLMEVPML
jgi:hypothetical protein